MSTKIENNSDASADAETVYSISLGDVFQGTLDPVADKDWVKVELTAGTIYDITLMSVESARLELLDSTGSHIVTGSENPTGSKLIFKPSISGTYYVHVGSNDDTFSGGYELSLVENTIPVGNHDEIADYLTDGYWEANSGTRSAFDVEPGGIITADITALTEEGQQLARWALEAWTNVTGIKFEFVENDAHITFDDDVKRPGAAGFSESTSSNEVIVSSNVNISIDTLTESGTTIGSYSFTTYIHEIGHALGLGHPGPYNNTAYYGLDNIFLNDSEQISVMSYMNQNDNTYLNASYAHIVTPMIADIIAIQNLYGIPVDINAGDTIYGYQSNLDGYLGEFFKLWTGEINPFINVDMTDDTVTPVIKLRLADLDNDGDPDLVIGDYYGVLYYFENAGTQTEPVFTERLGTANPLEGISVGSYSSPTFSDLDGDGDHDLIVGNGNGAIAYFENTGTVTSPNFTQRTSATNPFDNITMGTLSTLALADLDGDSDQDLVVGVEDGVVQYYENTGTSANADFVLRAGEASPLSNINAGPRSTPVFVDLDDDNDFDLVIGNRNGDIFYFENTGTTTSPSFTQRTNFDNPFHGTNAGSFIAPVFVDLDGNGTFDLVIGNFDGVIHYLKNTGTDADPGITPQTLSHPTTLTIYDNSGNDTLDLRTDKDDQRVYLSPEGISDVYGLTGNLIIARDTVIENFIAGAGNDLIAGNAVANYINGRDGDDRIWGSGGDDILEGGAGADRLDGDAGMDWVSYWGSDTAVTVNLVDFTVSGGHAEGDVLTEIENVFGSQYDDFLTGDDNTNWLEGGLGADQLDGGGGADWASYLNSNEGVTVDLAGGTAVGGHAQGDVITNIENVRGSNYGDALWGDDNANRLQGGEGDDQLWGRGGADTLEGGNGDDLLYGSTGADRLEGGAGYDVLTYQQSEAGVTISLEDSTSTGGYAEGDDIAGIEQIFGSDYQDVLTGDIGPNVLYGIGGDDTLRGKDGEDVLEGGEGADQLDGGAGEDWVSYFESDAGVMVNLDDNTAAGGHAQGDVITNVENLAGSEYRDVLTGDNGPNGLRGRGGDDELRGSDGDDVLDGGDGADQLDGGAGVDWVLYLESNASVTVNLSNNTAAGGHAQGDTFNNIENVAGSLYGDALTGDDGTNKLYGLDGDDELRGDDGDDVLEGGAGADKLYGGVGKDTASYRSSYIGVTVNLKQGTLEGGHANGDTLTDIENLAGSVFPDVLVGNDEANRLDGNEGDDELKGGIGNDQLFGNQGDDRLFGEAGSDNLYGDEGDDELHGGDDNDQLFGGNGDDKLYGNEGDDELNGGNGNDLLFGRAGADEMDGGNGIDWVTYEESNAGVTIDLADGTGEGGHAQGDDITNVENLAGSDYGDVLKGDNSANILHGLDGDDELLGNGGNDILEGGAGTDRLNGGSGTDWASYRSSDVGITVNLADGANEGGHAEGDVLTSIENVTGSGYDDVITGDSGANDLQGGDGDDDLHGRDGADRLDGGGGIDWIFYWASDTGITVNLELGTGKGGHAEGDVIVDVERVMGSRHQDVLIGDDGENLLQSGAGNDQLQGKGGNDWLIGGAGADTLDGGEGADWVSYTFSDTGVNINLHEGTNEGGYAEGDVLVNVENARGSSHADVLIGDDASNSLRGLDGDDELSGNGGDDWLYGNAGADQLDGGGGTDRMYGNEGGDIFIFSAGHGDDRILDFTDGEDQIDLSAFNLTGFDTLTTSFQSNNVTIDLSEHGGGTILLEGFDIANLDATDFLF